MYFSGSSLFCDLDGFHTAPDRSISGTADLLGGADPEIPGLSLREIPDNLRDRRHACDLCGLCAAEVLIEAVLDLIAGRLGFFAPGDCCLFRGSVFRDLIAGAETRNIATDLDRVLVPVEAFATTL